MTFIKNNNYSVLPFLAILLLGACSNGYLSSKEASITSIKVADIENEQITRLSFVPTQNIYDNIEIILYQGSEIISETPPSTDSNSKK